MLFNVCESGITFFYMAAALSGDQERVGGYQVFVLLSVYLRETFHTANSFALPLAFQGSACAAFPADSSCALPMRELPE